MRTVKHNEDTWERVMIKQLASVNEIGSDRFFSMMNEINQCAHTAGLVEYTTYSRLWEYPWVWCQAEPLKDSGLCVLDLGSERSAMAWFLAKHGFDVTVSDRTARYFRIWRRAEARLGVPVRKAILDAQSMDWATGSVDICTSFSVFEHIPNKAAALSEMARVLKPGGLLLMTFDICEPEMGMSFPAWNGRATTMAETNALLEGSCWFEPGFAALPWNVEDISKFLDWHRGTSPHHNYVTCGVSIRRNQRNWVDRPFSSTRRLVGRLAKTIFARALWGCLPSPGTQLYSLCCRITAIAKHRKDAT